MKEKTVQTSHQFYKAFFFVICITTFVNLLTTQTVFGFKVHGKNADFFDNKVFSPDIHTVMLHSATWELSFPVIELGSEQQLELVFDDLSQAGHSYSYTLVHCDAGWNRSAISQQEYLEGFGQGTIHETSPSVNTTVDYIHHRLVFPEENCRPVLSGNYALVVFEEDPEDPVLIRRLYIADNSVHIEARITQPSPGEFRDMGQQLVFNVDYDKSSVTDPSHDITVVLRQNSNDNRVIRNPKPSLMVPGKLEFTGPDEAIFAGGNEFRSLDIKSMKYQTEKIALIDFQNPYYHVFLKTDESREFKPYFSNRDLNGGYYIDKEKSNDKQVEADYIYVHFSLSQPIPVQDNSFYVYGMLTGWQAGPQNRMTYNAEKQCMEATLLLKQGLYDYSYAIADQSGNLDEVPLEGNFFETTNVYEIFVYARESNGRIDRLLGYTRIEK